MWCYERKKEEEEEERKKEESRDQNSPKAFGELKIKVCGTFIVKFHIEIHLLKDASRYHENK